uniref:Uncharacterized protein n=1 Tax=Chromera velia CCMP2878 TaxID=1169474 RepID=A0A0G4GD12_9ALVE|eukprot:Cvel_21267.t1-p1 / transcript=Cvel_21267.t1 / gene=Cvel_21267 / organism=Chromera_velia_CCMP2878 / gene_product=hypothetical protein / transcript_product=hypothetical protein / location=Cvel_scaffold1979:7157-7939(-) / protein_length=261 / sequence_SO=supercontig / SO=protein_coding / is_pseudo=false
MRATTASSPSAVNDFRQKGVPKSMDREDVEIFLLDKLLGMVSHGHISQVNTAWEQCKAFGIKPDAAAQRLLFIYAAGRKPECACIRHDLVGTNYVSKATADKYFMEGARSNVPPYPRTNSKGLPAGVLRFVWDKIVFSKTVITAKTEQTAFVAACATGHLGNVKLICQQIARFDFPKETELEGLGRAIASGRMETATYVFENVTSLGPLEKQTALGWLWDKSFDIPRRQHMYMGEGSEKPNWPLSRSKKVASYFDGTPFPK